MLFWKLLELGLDWKFKILELALRAASSSPVIPKEARNGRSGFFFRNNPTDELQKDPRTTIM